MEQFISGALQSTVYAAVVMHLFCCLFRAVVVVGCRIQGITVRDDDGSLMIARILPGSIIEKQGTTRLVIYLLINMWTCTALLLLLFGRHEGLIFCLQKVLQQLHRVVFRET